LMEIGISLNRS